MAENARGAVLLAEGDARAAVVALRDAWHVWQDLEAPYEAARVRVLVGLGCRALGDDEAAAMELEAARTCSRRSVRHPMSRTLETLGGQEAASRRHGLTERELQVLRLVATGKTNHAIASELLVAEKTVDRHVSNIFTKLGVSSRAAATADAYQIGSSSRTWVEPPIAPGPTAMGVSPTRRRQPVPSVEPGTRPRTEDDHDGDATTSGLIQTGTIELYHEVCGSGPALLITGGTGDAGEWSNVAPTLGEQCTVITYDRRGMSRSPRPDRWAAISMAEAADDAAGLLRALVQEPALVVGHSGGASIACSLVVRHPELVRHAVLYEPPLLAVVPDGDAVVAGLQAAIEPAMAEGGPRRALEQFMRANAGDEVVDQWCDRSIPAEERDRLLGNGEAFFERELPVFAAFVPDRDAMRASGVPLTVVVGADNRDTWYGDAARWLAEGTGADLVEQPGGHAGVFTHSEAFIALVRRIVR